MRNFPHDSSKTAFPSDDFPNYIPHFPNRFAVGKVKFNFNANDDDTYRSSIVVGSWGRLRKILMKWGFVTPPPSDK